VTVETAKKRIGFVMKGSTTTAVQVPMDRPARALAGKEGRKATPGGGIRWWNLPRGWAHQGFFYLDRTQRLGRIIFEIVPTLIIGALISAVGKVPLASVGLWVASLGVAHTLNWMFNGNWWAGMLFAFPGLRNPGERATCDYLHKMAKRLENDPAISGVMIFGSACRGQWQDRSDLDVRLLRRPGWRHGAAGVLVLSRERLLALLARQPLDIYLADGIPFLRKMRRDERPIFLKKDDPRLDEAYPESGATRVIRLREPVRGEEFVAAGDSLVHGAD
jgi:predicted nucleotidyltransferase